MSRRIDIEITSLSGEVATWRAAGAKLPKGVVAASLVPGGPVVGGVYRADVEQFMEGFEVLSVAPPKTASPLDPRHEKLELIARDAKGPDVTVTYAPKGRGPRREGERSPRREGERAPRREGERPTRREGERGPRREGGRSPRPEGERSARRPGDRPARTGRPEGGRPREGRTERRGPVAPPMTTTHRNALLATLSPEQLPVAEQLLRGGMPSVRAAVETQNKNASAQGRPTVDPGTIERIAEDLLARTNLAAWKDRAAGGLGAGKELRLRDLRAIVTSAKTVSLDDEARAQLKELQGALHERVEALRVQWGERLDKAIEASDVTEALTLVGRPPDISTRVSAEAAAKVVALTSEFLRADQDPGKWRAVVELAVDTSIRRNVKPSGIPDDEASRAVAIHNAGAIPELAKLLGMKVPPPPPPAKNVRRPVSRRAS
ncbi:MAG: hypothetical protein B7Z69_08450 [Actinobacteria bacterium 21-73-9]|nr:MAG: hypothetical protein B7Z69_08450 [Actinobacteria bacterium 21-73-9]